MIRRPIQQLKILVVIVLTFAWSLTLNAQAKEKVSDEDMRELVRILFQRELKPVADGTDTVVLVGPNFNAAWIPTLPGFRFKQLGYQEQMQVAEFYGVLGPERRRGGIRVGLQKGNNCKRFGSLYTFRKSNGKWTDEADGATESVGGTGKCPGCKLESNAVYSVNGPTTAKPAKVEPTRHEPVLNGRVLTVSCYPVGDSYIECEMRLSLSLKNQRSEPLIVLQPFGEYVFWHGATNLFLSLPDSPDPGVEVFRRSHWPSFDESSRDQQLAGVLDQPRPPPNVTRVIPPNDSWEWQTTVSWRIEEDNHCDYQLGAAIGWNGIKQLTAPLWLTVSFEMWPIGLEHFRNRLGRNLKRRWRAYGDLYLQEGEDRRSSWSLTSEPIELDLRKVELSKQPR